MPLRSSEWTRVKRLASSASCAAYASRPTFVAAKVPPCGDHEAAGHDGVPGALDDRVGLAGEQGLVDLQAVGLHDLAVDHHLVAGAQFDDVVEHDLRGGHRDGGPVPPDRGPGLADDGQAVQGLLGAPLLDDADRGVRDDDEAEQAVLDRPHDQDDQEQPADDRVEPREDIRPYDFGHRARRPYGYVVDLPARDPFGDLRCGQPGFRGHFGAHAIRHEFDGTCRSAPAPLEIRPFRDIQGYLGVGLIPEADPYRPPLIPRPQPGAVRPAGPVRTRAR